MPRRSDAGRRRALCVARAEHAHADHRRDLELEHAGAGRRRGAGRHPVLARAVRQLLLRAGGAFGARRSWCSGRSRAISCLAPAPIRWVRLGAHQQPAVPRHRRADQQGAGGDSARIRTTRSIVPYTTVQKRLLGVHARQQHHDLGGRRRAAGAGGGADQRAAARAAPARSRAKKTTSWCARRPR